MGTSYAPRAVPSFGRMMVFVDGENITMRYQAMLLKGYVPRKEVVHHPDIFVWTPHTILPEQHTVLRATYYTYAVGDDVFLNSIRDKLKSLSFNRAYLSRLPNNVYPRVSKKEKKTIKGKGVDIQMTVDILTHVYQNNLETVYLVSGDGDYKPLIETVVRSGKQIYIAAFSDGLNASLKHTADLLWI